MIGTVIDKILPIIVIYFIGFLLKKIKLFDRDSGSLFLKLVFYLGLPSLIITSFSQIEISEKFFLIPLSAVITFLIIFAVSFVFTNLAKIKGKNRGVFLIATMIMNIGFVLPFFIRTFIGLIIGIMLSMVFNLGGINKIAVIVGSAAPVGYNTLTFSNMENLNRELAASIVSMSIIFGLVFVPFLILILK